MEINFCTCKEVFFVKAFAAPRQGEIVQIGGVDHIVKSVYWTVDYAYTKHIDNALRATVQLEALTDEESE